MDKTRNVAVIVGSLRKDSLNSESGQRACRTCACGVKLSIVDIGHLSIYNQDSDENPPAAWTEFRERIKAADAVLFVTPEHNLSVPAALKYAIDIGSRPLWQERLERKAGRGRQRVAGRHRWIRR